MPHDKKFQPNPAVRMLGMAEVCAITSMSRGTVYTLIKTADFPRPYQLGRRRVAWLEAEIIEWLKRQKVPAWAA